MKVLVNNVKVDKTYEEVCKDLGFLAAVKFVKITTRGTISFTCGKPNEIKSLRSSCIEHGYTPAKALYII